MEDKDTSSPDFGMGDEDAAENEPSQPKINNYADQTGKSEQPKNTADINPNGVSPTAQPESEMRESGQTIGQAKNQQSAGHQQQAVGHPHQTGQPQQANQTQAGQPQSQAGQTQTQTPGAPQKPKIAKKKALLGCFGAFGGIILILLIVTIIFISLSKPGQSSQIAQALGINQALLINTLITGVNILFFILTLILFILTMVGLFKTATAKKDDKLTKKKGLKMGIISGSLLTIILISWGFAFLYLDGKRIRTEDVEVLPPIQTTPEDTVLLSAPVEIRFDASSIEVDPSRYQIIGYNWDFGDGETGTNQIVTHTYENIGEFNVILTVKTRDLQTDEIYEDAQFTKLVTITNRSLSAIFEADPQSGEAPLEVKFDASESVDPDGTIESYEWDFDGDGEFDDGGVTAEYEFEKIGVYTVSLRVTSTTGEYAVAEKDIKVEEAELPKPIIDVQGEPEDFLTGTQYIFKADRTESPNGKITAYSWDFGDGTPPIKTKTASHTWQNEGTYDVILTVTDEDDKENDITLTIEVGAPQGVPKASLKTEPALKSGALSIEGEAPFTVVFDATGSTDADNNIVDYNWDFDGDGTEDGAGSKTSHTYEEPGTFTAELTVVDADGNEGKASTVVKVMSKGLTAILSADPIDGNVPVTVSFDATGSVYPEGQISSYEWDFGDGTAPKIGASTISHKYTKIGTFTAKVTVIGSDNKRDTDEIIINIREIPLTACFTSVFEEGEAPLNTNFDPSCSTGTIQNYFWDFGDGGTSTDLKPSHTFQDPGQYTVVLEVSDAENTIDTAELQISVN